jgi:hypothetical protein
LRLESFARQLLADAAVVAGCEGGRRGRPAPTLVLAAPI